MRILKSFLKHGEITVEVTSLDDLWALSQVIEPGDHVKGRTLRRIKVGDRDSTETVRKPVWIKLTVENVEFHKYSNVLRVGGMITEAPEDVPKAHHTFSFEEGTVAMITKEKWLNYQLSRIREASQERNERIVVCAFDREEAVFALLLSQGYKVLAEIRGQVEKKGQKSESRNFYKEIIKLLAEYSERFNAQHLIVASPSFWKDELLKELGRNELKTKIVTATCSSVTKGIDEVLKSSELKGVLRQERTAKESRLVEELFLEISRQGNASYGLAETENASQAGAVRILMVTDGLIQKTRQDGSFGRIEKIMRSADTAAGEVAILNSDNDPGKKLDGLGGIAALLRYKTGY
ncbi:mRNA surveillance protein pelota [Candidatus Woesearchaeota archaeon]|nr:mRNA surveillance protein pelota [Candidatus Woesearchaeota archaeon]